MEEGNSSLSHESLADYAPLIRATLEDDWKAAEAFIHNHPDCLSARITKEEGTALHNAVAARRTHFVKKLVKLMEPEDLELTTIKNCTALSFAAQSKIVTIAKEMVKKNERLPLIPKDDIKVLPLYVAIMTGNRDMVSYLYSVTRVENLDSMDRIKLLCAAISTNMYDTTLKILDTLKTLAPDEKELHLWHPLNMLAKRPSDIGSKSQASLWERCLNYCFRGRLCNKALMQASARQLVYRVWKEIGGDNFSSNFAGRYHTQLLPEAAKEGNVEFLIILIRCYPDLIWKLDEKVYVELFNVAIKHRQEHVFNLIYEIGGLKGNQLASFYAYEKHNMLDNAADLPPIVRLNIVSGEALQMQRELLWFQEIEKIVPKPSSISLIAPMRKEEEKPTSWAWDLFVDKHKDLRKNGEKWMRNTANSCMLVAALIVTVVFPAAFTVPGGNNQQTGIPIFLESSWFTVFFISDAVAILFSSSSILVFLSILTSRYTEKDFLKSLPRRLALGLLTLLISIVGMLIAFSAASVLVFKRKTSVPIGIIVAAPAVPISLFLILHHGLWFDIFRSAFFSNGFLFRSRNRLFKQARWLASKKDLERQPVMKFDQITIKASV